MRPRKVKLIHSFNIYLLCLPSNSTVLGWQGCKAMNQADMIPDLLQLILKSKADLRLGPVSFLILTTYAACRFTLIILISPHGFTWVGSQSSETDHFYQSLEYLLPQISQGRFGGPRD